MADSLLIKVYGYDSSITDTSLYVSMLILFVESTSSAE